MAPQERIWKTFQILSMVAVFTLIIVLFIRQQEEIDEGHPSSDVPTLQQQQQQQQQTVSWNTILGRQAWGGVDESIALQTPITDIAIGTLDTPTRLFPAGFFHGTLYVEEGNLVIKSGDVYVGDYGSLKLAIETAQASECARCFPGSSYPCCNPQEYINATTCECTCKPGYTGIGCNQRICYNNGTWSEWTQTCTCVYPFTGSLCADIDCGPRGMMMENGTCACIMPHYGASCNLTTSSPAYVSLASTEILRSCWDPASYGVGDCGKRSNWGVSMCVNDTLCVCAPVYRLESNTVVARYLSGPGSRSWFELKNETCCQGPGTCEDYQRQIFSCTTEWCCNGFLTQHACLATSNCAWTGSGGCVYDVNTLSLPAGSVWHRLVIDCTAENHRLCNRTTALAHRFVSLRPGGYQQIQTMAWPLISQYDLWQDGLPHSIVYSEEQNTWRLTLLLDNTFISSVQWQRGVAGPVQRAFWLQLVQNDSRVPPAAVGSVYTVWTEGLNWCLLDRVLQDDEKIMYGVQPVSPVVAMNVAAGARNYQSSGASCGLFVIQDNSFVSLLHQQALGPKELGSATPYAALLNVSGLVFSDSLPVVTTPPSYLDTNPFEPTSLVLEGCRFLECRLADVRGACASVSCASSFFDQPATFSACLPCLKAHVHLSEP